MLMTQFLIDAFFIWVYRYTCDSLILDSLLIS